LNKNKTFATLKPDIFLLIDGCIQLEQVYPRRQALSRTR